MTEFNLNFADYHITAVIPAYKVEKQIEQTLASLPDFIREIIVVDDASPDSTSEIVARVQTRDARIRLVRHDVNQGVGGAMLTGFKEALKGSTQVVLKVDGDGQMSGYDPRALLEPLILGRADYAKGNRFRDFNALKSMPRVRILGNMTLSFSVKMATGYWDRFDPSNGFLAIRREALEALPLENIRKSYLFETSMLSELYLIGAVVEDVAYPAFYGDEISNISPRRLLLEFPPALIFFLLRRIWLKNFLFDFSMISIYLLTGLPMFLLGLGFGIVKWIKYYNLGIPAPTGTIMIPVMLVMLGTQLLLAAANLDFQSIPRIPISHGALTPHDS